MSFRKGRVTFCRFAVQGDGPASVDEAALSCLASHAFAEQSLGVPQELEAGWVTGEHVLDTQFDYAKNGFGNMMLFALRLDTHKVPPDIKQAYQRIQELAMVGMKDNPTGFLSKSEKHQVQQDTQRQLQEELASGKYRKSKMIAVLWDLQRHELYFESAGAAAVEQLHKLMADTFHVTLDLLTAGRMVRQWMEKRGKTRDFEDLQPSAFTEPPAIALAQEEINPTIPDIPWTADSLDTKDFLGNEMLMWMWWIAEVHEGILEISSPDRTDKTTLGLILHQMLEMQCAWGLGGKQSLRSETPTRMAEAGEALTQGKWPRKAGMILSDLDSSDQWELGWQADRLIISSAKLPPVEEATSARELLEARLLNIRKLGQFQTGMVHTFIESRTSAAWPDRVRAIRQWIHQRRRPVPSPTTPAHSQTQTPNTPQTPAMAQA